VPPKSAIGKGVKVSSPATGTIKSSTGVTAIAASSLSLSKQSSNTNVSIEKVEESKPTEIVALADFNRVYEPGGFLTPYGRYYEALDAVHSVTTDDVSYATSKCIEKDTSGQWSSLKTSLESAIEDADDFVEDLARIDEKLEQAIKSLDFIRPGDPDIQQAGQDYLTSKLRDYETPASERKFEIDSILVKLPTLSDPNPPLPSETFSSTGGNATALKKILNEKIRSKIDTKPFGVLFDSWGQGRDVKDLNPAGLESGIDGGRYWKYFSSTGVRSLVEPVEILTRALSISTGIVRVEQDSLAQKLSFKMGNLGSMFEGTKPAANGGQVADPLPFKKNSASSSLIALSMLQYKSSDGTWIVPVEIEDAPEKRDYKSGPTALIREPLLAGDYKFSDLDSFISKFEEGRLDIEAYSEKMLGLLDPTNGITTVEVFRTILSNFNEALGLASSDESSKYQLLYTCLAGNSGNSNASLNHQILRIAGRIKYYKVKSRSGTGTGEDATTTTKLVTAKVSEKSESLKSDAVPTTTQTENKSDTPTTRTITRTAGGSPPSADMSGLMLAFMRLIAGSDQLTGEELNQRATIATALVKNLESFKTDFVLTIEDKDDLKIATDRINKQIDSVKSYIRDLRAQAARTPPYTEEKVIAKYYEDAMKKTSGTFWSFIVKAYDEIVQKAEKRLPDGEKMTDALGRTLYGGFDEFGLLAMIVRCFVVLSAPLGISVARSYKTPQGRIQEFVNAVNSGDIADALDAFLKGNEMAVIGFSSNLIKDYREELTLLTSDMTESETKLFQFSSATLASEALSYLRSDVSSYQNSVAYLTAFSKVMQNSKNDLIDAFSNILETSSRKDVLDTPKGREMMSSLTTQQIVYRRSLLDKYRPIEKSGYLPAKFAFSLPESIALKSLLTAPQFSDRSSENIRLIAAAIPAGTIDNSKKYRDPDLGQQNYTGMVEMVVHRRDHELDDLIFKEKIFLFDPQLYVVPGSFDTYRRSKTSSTSDRSLEIAKRISYKLYSREGSETLSYQDFASNSRYKDLTSKQIDEIVKNATFSYLMESYLYKTTGLVFDESVTLDVKDTVLSTALAALNSVSQQKLTDLVLPTPAQLSSFLLDTGDIDYLNQAEDVTTGDKELIAALVSSYLMREEKPIDRLLANSLFDRVVLVAVDPDTFAVDKEETTKKNGEVGKSMLKSLQKNGYLIESNGSTLVIPRDPLNGGFSVGDISCQFIPHTSSKTEGSMLKIAKAVLTQKDKSEKKIKAGSQNQDSSKISKSIISKGIQR